MKKIVMPLIAVAAIVLVGTIYQTSRAAAGGSDEFFGPDVPERAYGLDMSDAEDEKTFVTLLATDTPFIHVDLNGPPGMTLGTTLCSGERPRFTCFIEFAKGTGGNGTRATSSRHPPIVKTARTTSQDLWRCRARSCLRPSTYRPSVCLRSRCMCPTVPTM